MWVPQPGPQTMAVLTPAHDLGFGGAAGGGKTDLIVGLSFTEHRRSLILRREGTQLRAIVERSKEIVDAFPPAVKLARYNETLHIWRGIPGKRFVEMGGIPHIGNEKKYQGQNHDFKAHDEATEIAESQFRFVNGWNRTSIPGQRSRVVATFNPPTTAEGKWVIRYWAPWLDPKHPKPAKPGELRWFTTIDDQDVEVPNGTPFEHKGEIIEPVSRTFIPARLSDNRFYAGSQYQATLQALPEPLRSQMLHGDFSAGIKDDPWQVIPTEHVLLAQKRWRERSKPQYLPLTGMGVDVARGGSDKTVIAYRYGNWFAPLIKAKGAETPDGPAVADLVTKTLVEEGQPVTQAPGRAINVDVIGVGAAAYDALKTMQVAGLTGINVATATEETDKSGQLGFFNLRAESLWKLREALDPKTGDDLALPDDSELLADLTAAKWSVTTRGIKIESKEDIKERIGRSPDCADALVLALLVKHNPAQQIMDFYQQQAEKQKGNG
jgi:hypothetical protein